MARAGSSGSPNPNAKFLFAFLFIGWAVVFGIGLQLVPHTGANSPYGGIGLIALFSGFFIMMGFLWASSASSADRPVAPAVRLAIRPGDSPGPTPGALSVAGDLDRWPR